MAEKKKATKEQEPSLEIPINFNLPVGFPSVYATNFVVQMGDEEIILSFYEVQQPFFLQGSPEENLEILKTEGVRADCVARITISKNRFVKFADVLQQAKNQIPESNK